MATHAATRTLSGLARAMVQHGLLSEYDADTLQGQAQAANIGFVEQMLLSKRMTAMQVAMFASRAFGTPMMDLNGFDIDHIDKDLIDAKLVASRRALPLHKRGNRLFVAVSDPANLQVLDEVRFRTNLVVDAVVVEDDKLSQTIAKVAETTGQKISNLVSAEDLEIDVESGARPAEDEANPDVDDAPVVRYLQKILVDAISAVVSDIHFEPYERFYRIRYRLDGQLMEIAQPPLAIKDKMASRIKVISKLDISEKRVPQDGRMKLVLSKNRAIDFRVSTLPTLFGEKIVLRILDSAGVKLGIEALGYEPDQQQLLLNAIRRPYGMILVTGPTGIANMGVAPVNIASSVILITAQRLARKLCPQCKRPEDIPPEALLRAGFTEEDLDASWQTFGPIGCDHCKGTGYKGRIGVYEVMPISDEMRQLIMRNGNALDIADLAQREGVRNLRQSGLLKVKQGVTSLEEIEAITNE